jgi:serine phosphatase RsbU (regulator of sigma subunit)
LDIDAERRAREELAGMYEREHSVAHAFQQASLPPRLPLVEGVLLHGFYKPGSADLIVGGDWYDAFVTRSGALVLSIGDVMGHGLDAAIVMGKIRNSIRALMLQTPNDAVDLPALFVSVERALESEAPDASATAFIGVVSPDHRRLDYASAGHPPPLMRTHSGTACWLETNGAPLGWSFGTLREQRQVPLDRPCALVLFTDGLVEASRDVEAGLLKLSQLIERGEVLEDSFPASAILSRAACAEPSDDVAVLTAIFAVNSADG